MHKIELLSRINKISGIVHSSDAEKFAFSSQTIQELQAVLNHLTEEYIHLYCKA